MRLISKLFVNVTKARLKFSKLASKLCVSIAFAVVTFCTSLNVGAIPSNVPLFLANPVRPMMMINLSKDHQLYFKAYDDYSDITDATGSVTARDGAPDTTYNTKYTYFGYFDVYKCYKYSATNNRFEPSSWATLTRHYCNQGSNTGEWSGNFMNWATMTRLDVVRKILYGGYRSTDSSTDTTLERAFITSDAHAFAKYYYGKDIKELTPFNINENDDLANKMDDGITICNVSYPIGGASATSSQSATYPPLIRVAKGNFMFWASNERWQCTWSEEKNKTLNNGGVRVTGSNGNYNDATPTTYLSGYAAYNDNPTKASHRQLESGLTSDYIARVQPCVAMTATYVDSNGNTVTGPRLSEAEDPIAGGNGECFKYPNALKPVGLLQQFGESSLIKFGLMTGSYGKNKSGGVLRKPIGGMDDEINSGTDGTFIIPASGSPSKIISTLNTLRPYGYDYGNGLYNTLDNCAYGLNTFADGSCSNWGNPQAEIMLESLRYLSGVGAGKETTAFAADDSGRFAALKNPTWDTPLNTDNFCASTNILQFNNSSTSYDEAGAAQFGTVTDLGGTTADIDTNTDLIGTKNNLAGNSWFFGKLIGGAGVNDLDGLCTAKTMSSLSKVSGTCTDAPRLDGGYAIAGLAYYARSKGITVTSASGKLKSVHTFGVALAPSVPKIEVKVPSSSAKVIIQPACRNSSVNGNCAIVDFKILSQSDNVTIAGTGDAVNFDGQTGSQGVLYVNWEDSEQGGDYDQDMWGLIAYAVTGSKVWVKTRVIAQSTPNAMGFGYVIGGTTTDGFKVHAGINGFTDGYSCTAGTPCTCLTSGTFGACNSASAARAVTYAVGTGSASNLESPLYYASQWGGYSDDFETNANSVLKTPLVDEIAKRNPKADKFGNNYFYSNNPQELKDDLRNVFSAIADRVASAAAVATDSTRLSSGTALFQAQFNSKDWTGDVYTYKFDAQGQIVGTTDALGKFVPTIVQKTDFTATTASKNIYVGIGGGAIKKLTTAPAAGSAIETLFGGASDPLLLKRIGWFLGSSTDEGASTGLRDRGTGIARNTLGDIVNSSPVLVDKDKDYRFTDPMIPGNTLYNTYVAAKSSTKNLMVVGANDGMVHVLDVDSSATSITELYSYMPSMVFPKVLSIAKDTYGKTANPHQYLVDGPITTSDVYIDDGTGSKAWRTVAVGTLGAGGIGVFALDITDPTTPRLLFELTKADYPQMGYVMGSPIIVPLRNGQWGAIFGNGDSSGSTSQLFVIDLENPKNSAYSKVLNTGAGTGLSAPAVLANSSRIATSVYAGDLNGNLWHFDLSSTSPSSWVADYLLFKATDTSSPAKQQPIFAAPTVGRNYSKSGDYIVYVGTGKYYDDVDKSPDTTMHHSFYAITDIAPQTASPSLSSPLVTRSSLGAKTLKTANYSATPPTRGTDESIAIDWTTKNGWYLDYAKDGERVTTKALLIADKVIFPTLIPSSVACQFGGTSWLMRVSGVGDRFMNDPVLKDDIYNTFLVLGDLGFGLTKKGGNILGSGSDGTPLVVPGQLPPIMYGRQSWRQLK